MDSIPPKTGAKRSVFVYEDGKPVSKTCSACQQHLPVDSFYRDPKSTSGYRTICIPCITEINRERHNRDPRKKMSKSFEQLYGMTITEYDRLFEEQGGVCAICGKPETAKTRYGTPKQLAVDHCHRTGKLRGLLCIRCNTWLGYQEKDPERLIRAADYLKRHRGDG